MNQHKELRCWNIRHSELSLPRPLSLILLNHQGTAATKAIIDAIMRPAQVQIKAVMSCRRTAEQRFSFLLICKRQPRGQRSRVNPTTCLSHPVGSSPAPSLCSLHSPPQAVCTGLVAALWGLSVGGCQDARRWIHDQKSHQEFTALALNQAKEEQDRGSHKQGRLPSFVYKVPQM